MKRNIVGALLISIFVIVISLGVEREVVFTEAGQELATSLGYEGKAEDFNVYIGGIVSKLSSSKEVYSDEVKQAMQVRFYQQHHGLLIQENAILKNSLMGKLASILLLLLEVSITIIVALLVIVGVVAFVRLLLGKDSLEDYKKEIYSK